jgi:uncharacterized protein YqjF (DUF2071 family)
MGRKPFLTTVWSNLAMLNYEIDHTILQPFLPRGTELDCFNGKHFVSIVGFLYSDTRIRGFSIPGYREFSEVNLRFYIRYRAPEGWRRGVAFIKEIVPFRAVALVARKLYDENFVMRPMRHNIEATPLDSSLPTRVEYAWKDGLAWQGLQLTMAGEAALPGCGSAAEFITEHYWGYTARRDGTTSEYLVEHPPWKVLPAISASFDCDVASVYGCQFVDSLSAEPCSAFLAKGSAVAVYPGRKL